VPRPKRVRNAAPATDPAGAKQAAYDALGLPDAEFDHATFVAEELEPPRFGQGRPRWMIVTAAGLILLLLLWLLA
jgi:hypothetical protein